MAIIKPVSNSSDGQVPFLQDYFDELDKASKAHMDDQLFEIDVIKAVDSGKGFMVTVYDHFSVFIWKNSGSGKFLQEYIGNCEHALFVQTHIDEKLKKVSFDLCLDDEIEAFIRQDLFHHSTFFIVQGKKPPIAPLKTLVNQKSVPEVMADITAKNSKAKQ